MVTLLENMPPSDILAYVHKKLKNIKNQCKNGRGKKKNRKSPRVCEFNLTDEWVLEELKRLNYACPYTGKKFVSGKYYKGNAHPFTLSFDRKDTDYGYTTDNVILSTLFANTLKSNLSYEELVNLEGVVLTPEFLQRVMKTYVEKNVVLESKEGKNKNRDKFLKV